MKRKKGVKDKENFKRGKISKKKVFFKTGECPLANAKFQEEINSYSKDLIAIQDEISKVVIGHAEVVQSILRGFLANGHVLIEGVPGIAKTLLIRTLANASGCQFSRIQFTVDLLPTDITGVTTYDQAANAFTTIKGPIFSNFIIADEVNRAPPKSQSALLEAMQEKQVTIGKHTHKLPSPFFVMANNNPLESSGTYPLPEAQIDRFLFKVLMDYTSLEDESKIIDKNITTSKFEEYNIKPAISPSKILKMQRATKKIFASDKIKKYIVRIVDSTRNSKKYDLKLGKYIEWGASPRASIGLTIAAKADALLKGSCYVTPQNVKNVIFDVLRHRLILNYQGQAENIKSDIIIEEILKKVPLP
ncbi:MoxR family ATPase [archaeon]|jgi:MoxR-like ATPase|nr:MoxR family ATPase [archaeon]MBT4373886.1 MoxR family ATPase [archaeon]MBT4532408.1 MoxR family ATPase [archaeon]MBT7001789.1 MoxR family ATPase [archaeon]MBT7281886.1 MoxR family ATPase [archaeon]